jgi:DNA repair protein RadD
MLIDRPYQTEAVESIWNYFRSGNIGNPVVAMPTGTGKSIVIARFCQSALTAWPQTKILVLTHVKELIQQNYEKMMMLWAFAPAGIYSAGLNRKDLGAAITFAGIASVAKIWAMFGKVDLIIVDEAHLVSPTDATMYRAFIAGLKSINPHLKVIGLTATPWRLGHGRITDPVEVKGKLEPALFTDVCFDITGLEAFNRLIAEGYLCPLVPRRTRTLLDVSGVHMRGGEFIESELQAAVDQDHITEAALREAIEIGHDRKKWLIFASGTDHADHIAEMLTSFGVPCGSVHSKRAGRDETIRDFKAGRLRAVVNNNVLTTGFDDPEIDMIVVLRPTASAVLWVQMLGRGTRPLYAPGFDLTDLGGRLSAIAAGGKHNCLVLDYAGNTKKLGPINDPVVPRRKGEKGGTAPVKCCDVCETWNHASVKYCGGQPIKSDMGCGHEFTFMTKLQMAAASEDLIKGDLPVVEVLKVDHITYSRHEKVGSAPMMKVSYFCGIKAYDEYVLIEHADWGGRKARKWWKERSLMPFPESTDTALMMAPHLAPATHLRVWLNKKYPEIMSACFDGSAFGTTHATDVRPGADVEKPRSKYDTPERREALHCLEDDIPF